MRDTGPRLLARFVQGRRLLTLGVMLLAGGCSLFDEAPSRNSCVPMCAERACGDDGCGGSCGKCLPGSLCQEGLCVQAVDDCSVSCGDLSIECGERCGVSCGSCDAGERCVDYRCECAPRCQGRACTDSDGCGGTCGPCPTPISCEDCELELVRLTDELVAGVRYATLAIDFAGQGPLATTVLADLRLEVVGSATLERVGLAPALLSAGKELLVHPDTGQPFQRLDGGVYRLVVTSPHTATPIGAGRWLFLRFRVSPSVTERPVQFKLVRRAQVLAPIAADNALQQASFDAPVVLPLAVGSEGGQ